MTKEINQTGNIITDKNGDKWLPVNISFKALSLINKIVLGDSFDDDDLEKLAKVKDVHEDCLSLIKAFK